MTGMEEIGKFTAMELQTYVRPSRNSNTKLRFRWDVCLCVFVVGSFGTIAIFARAGFLPVGSLERLFSTVPPAFNTFFGACLPFAPTTTRSQISRSRTNLPVGRIILWFCPNLTTSIWSWCFSSVLTYPKSRWWVSSALLRKNEVWNYAANLSVESWPDATGRFFGTPTNDVRSTVGMKKIRKITWNEPKPQNLPKPGQLAISSSSSVAINTEHPMINVRYPTRLVCWRLDDGDWATWWPYPLLYDWCFACPNKTDTRRFEILSISAAEKISDEYRPFHLPPFQSKA